MTAKPNVGTWWREREAIREELQRLEAETRAADPDYFSLAQPLKVQGIKELARTIDNTLVVPWVGVGSSIAYLVTPAGDLIDVPLPDLTDPRLVDWVNTWHRDYGGYRSSRTFATRDTWQERIETTLRSLDDALMAPIISRLPETGWGIALIISGLLSMLPLHAAPSILKAEIPVCYAPSAWVLDRCVRRSRPGWAPVLGIAVDPTERLSYGEWELDRIDTLFRAACPDPITRLIGPEATFEAVTRELLNHRTSYVSCHGMHDFQNPLQSRLILHDEHLTLEHLLGRMRLDVARLIVLSACETGIGVEFATRGEEFIGLPSGFIVAGAKSVIGSLWAVDDLATALLMVRLFENLRDRQGIAEALREAQAWLANRTRPEVEAFAKSANFRDKAANSFEKTLNALDGEHPFRHPQFWAAFAVLGSPEPLIAEEQNHAEAPPAGPAI
jgi:CHAT domain-containing protein